MSKPLNRVEWPSKSTLAQLQERCADINDPLFWKLYDRWRSQTLIPPDRLYMSYCALRNVVDNEIEGDVVECGVFRGGSFCFFLDLMNELGCRDRQFWAYDTFDGFPEDVDETLYDGSKFVRESWHTDSFESIFKENLGKLQDRDFDIRVVKGSVLDTIPENAPAKVAFMHLDTDYYEATLHELVHLYERVSRDGSIMIDDYGHFDGARKAVDTFCESLTRKPLILRADYSGRLLVPR